MLQSLKNMSLTKKIGYALAGAGVCTTLMLGVLGCGTASQEYQKQRVNQAIEEAVQRRNNAYRNRPYIPAQKSLYKSQDLSTVGERGPNFKDYSEDEMNDAKKVQEESEIPRRDTPLRIPPGYDRARTQ